MEARGIGGPADGRWVPHREPRMLLLVMPDCMRALLFKASAFQLSAWALVDFQLEFNWTSVGFPLEV